jgi:hypothetical protein
VPLNVTKKSENEEREGEKKTNQKSEPNAERIFCVTFTSYVATRSNAIARQ